MRFAGSNNKKISFLLLTRSRGLETGDGGSRQEARDAGGERQERQGTTERKLEKGEQREGTRDEAKAEERRAKEVVHLYTHPTPDRPPPGGPVCYVLCKLCRSNKAKIRVHFSMALHDYG